MAESSVLWLIAKNGLRHTISMLVLQIYSQQAGWVKRDEHSLLKTATSSLEHSSLTQPEWLYNRAL